MNDTDFRERLAREMLDPGHFVRAIFSGRQRGAALPWRRVELRPVQLRGRWHLQVSRFDETRDVTKNYAPSAAPAEVRGLLALPFRTFYVQTTSREIQVRISKKGKVFVHEEEKQTPLPSLAHDRSKDLPLPADTPDPFLQAIGIMTQEGKVRARRYSKFRQINEFLRLLEDSGALDSVGARTLRVIDCGCGSAHLTFAVYHYFNHVCEVPTRVVGVDVNAELLRKRARLAERLGWEGITFEVARIIDYTPPAPPDIVLALHACDTATDEALAQAVRWESRMIFSVPCCHHHVQAQLQEQPTPAVFAPLLRHGILRERMGDLLTDSLRAQLLRVLGYHADVVEFISPEHTAKNLMLRAEKVSAPDEAARQEYEQLKSYWGVAPYLEHLLTESGELPA